MEVLPEFEVRSDLRARHPELRADPLERIDLFQDFPGLLVKPFMKYIIRIAHPIAIMYDNILGKNVCNRYRSYQVLYLL